MMAVQHSRSLCSLAMQALQCSELKGNKWYNYRGQVDGRRNNIHVDLLRSSDNVGQWVLVMPEWYLYIVRCHDGSLYTGISTDVERRFAQHQGNGDSGSKYLKSRGPLTLVFQERVGTRSLALKVETKVKKLSREKKKRLIGVPGYIEGIVKLIQAP